MTLSLDEFRSEARRWLEANAELRPLRTAPDGWGRGSDSVALFKNLDHAAEQAAIDAARAWIQKKADAGWAHLTWEPRWGGRGLAREFERAWDEEEHRFTTPSGHEAIGITTNLVAPTIGAYGTEEQKERYLRPMLRTDEMWCQLYSEPGAGSDLAGAATTAVRDGDEWVINGQKVWTSGAQFAQFGYVLCRTDPTVPKHHGLTTFLIDMATPGVEVRPLRQMTGGSSFNEVFLTDVRVPSSGLLGKVGRGWSVALTTLGFERGSTGGGAGASSRLIALARHLGRTEDPLVRQALAGLHIDEQVRLMTRQRVRAGAAAGAAPGPEGSIGKLTWTEGLRRTNDVAALLLGPALVADTGAWGTYAWGEHLLGTAGYRVAGGTDEIQRNILGERVLGLPGEPRVDRDVPFRDVPR